MNNNELEIIEQFKTAMAEAGMVVDEPLIADDRLHRVYVVGDKAGTKNGAYLLHLNGKPSGYFEHFPKSLKQTWSASGSHRPLSLSDRKAIETLRKQRAAERKQRQLEAAQKAQAIWHCAKPLASGQQHAYLIQKQVKPFDVRLYRNALVIALYDEAGQLVNLQFIKPDGEKRFLSGGRKKECFALIGNRHQPERLLICEGWATGASLHQSLTVLVLVAMDAGNLEPVARVARRLYPKAEIIIAGDNDASGTGQTAAKQAALAVGGKYLIPEQTGDDWNDVLSNGEAA